METFRPSLFRMEKPLGFTKRGEPFWLHRGGSTDAGDAGGTGTTGAQSGAGGDGTTGQGAGTASGDQTGSEGAQSGTESATDKVERAEFEAIQRRLSAADKAREEAQQALKAIEDAKKDDATKATERAEAAEAKVSALEQEVQQLRLERAMLADAEFGADKWQDPEEVLDKINRAVREERITVKDGQPEEASVKTFLKDLATKKPYLLKAKDAGTASGKSGEQLGAGDRRKAGQEATDEEIKKRYRIR